MADRLRFMFDRDFDDPDEVYDFVPELDNSESKKEDTPSGMISISDLLGSINSKLVLDTDKDLDTEEISKLRNIGKISEDRLHVGPHPTEQEVNSNEDLSTNKETSTENEENSEEIKEPITNEDEEAVDKKTEQTDISEQEEKQEINTDNNQEEAPTEKAPSFSEPINELRKQGLLFTKEELDTKVKELLEEAKEESYNKGKAEGYELGKNDAQQSNEAAIQGAISHICEEIDKQGELISKSANDSFESATNLALSIIKKMFPTLEKKHGIDEIVNMLEKNFHFLREEPKITLKIHPDILEGLKPKLSELVKSNGYSGKLALLKNEKLGLSDCVVEWSHGFLQRNVSDILDETEKLVDTFKE